MKPNALMMVTPAMSKKNAIKPLLPRVIKSKKKTTDINKLAKMGMEEYMEARSPN